MAVCLPRIGTLLAEYLKGSGPLLAYHRSIIGPVLAALRLTTFPVVGQWRADDAPIICLPPWADRGPVAKVDRGPFNFDILGPQLGHPKTVYWAGRVSGVV
jgi:hypothetical protein